MTEQEITVDILDPLFSALDDPNKGVSLQAIETLSRVLTLKISSKASALIKKNLNSKLLTEDSESRLAVALVLADTGNPEAMPELLAHLSDPDLSQRLEIAEKLSLLADTSVADVIQEAFQSELDTDVRSWLALALAHAGITGEIGQMFRANEFRPFPGFEGSCLDTVVRDWLRDKQFLPFPKQTKDFFQRISEETKITSDIASEFVRQFCDVSHIDTDQKIVPEEEEDEWIINEAISVLEKIRIGVPLDEIDIWHWTIPFLPGEIARHVVTIEFPD